MKKMFVYGAAVILALGAGTGLPSPSVRVASAKQPTPAPAPEIWHEVEEASLGMKTDDRLVAPERYRVFRADEAALADALAAAPEEWSGAAKASGGALLRLPMPDGSLQRFRVQESSVMEAPLQARFPQIRTYVAQGVDDPAATVRLDRTQLGFHAQILSPNGRVFVDPYRRGDAGIYVSYYTRDYVKPHDDFQCLVTDTYEPEAKTDAVAAVTGQTLRTYRLALACTGEYSVAVCNHNGVAQTVDNTFAGMVTSVNRVVGVYEQEVAVRMVLVANDTSLVYLNGSTDPYTNNNGSTMLGQNQTNITNVIGTANYDIGHVFSTGGGGVAGLGVVCNASNKARGVTGLSTPYGDDFDIDYVAHEMGHQFGGNHTFNSTTGSCGGGNRAASAAYETGSGSTIMAYAGICGSADLQPHSDPYFHAKSFDEIVAYTNSGGGNGCAVQSATGNSEPTIDAGAAYTIPANTPFELTAGVATDPQGDALTYCWEEFDLGAAVNTNTDNGSSPIIRSYNPSTSPTRVIPKITNLINNVTVFGEIVPTTSRTMTFRCTARDNRAGGGGVSFDTTTVTSTTTAGPFAVTAPNTAVSVGGNTALNVTWNVASTNTGSVNTPNVTIYLSVNGGNSFPIVLKANTPNDGSETVTVPNVPTTQARIKVKGAGNVFFDISNANFTITSAVTGGDSAAVYVPATGTYFERNSNSAGAADNAFGFGPSPSALVPLSGDWDGDHTNTPGLYDPATGNFFLKNSNSPGGADITFSFGAGGAGIVPLAGDWNGDGVDSIGLYNSATGVFFLKNTNAPGSADIVVSFGVGGTLIPVTGDWNGDVTDTIGLYDPGTGNFFLKNFNVPGPADIVFSFGAGGAMPVSGDFNLDGTDSVGLYSAATGTWFLKNTNAPGAADVVFGFGPTSVTPLTGDWDGL